MHRWLLLAGLVCFVVAACHSKSFSPPGEGDDAGDDGGPCGCAVGATVIPCSLSACVEGVDYLCSGGTPLEIDLCGSDAGGGTDGSGLADGECIPTTCNGLFCNIVSNCGGLCPCAAGVTCNPNGTCGNGCDLGVGQACLPDGGSSTTCCGSGFACLSHEAGPSTCCAVFGAGHCTVDTDCCDYPSFHCQPSTGMCG